MRNIFNPFLIVKFYATIEPCRRLKHFFTNLSSFYIIDVDSILEESGLDVTKPSHQFLINTELERLICIGARSKRYTGLIYINSKMNYDTISSIRSSLNTITNSVIETLVILDDYDTPKMKEYYKMFDEVIFFPSIKRTKIVECVPLVLSKLKKKENDKDSSK